jgi:membrane protein YqaA with SNARE-associated domain
MIDQIMTYYAEFQELASNSIFQEWGIFGLFVNALLSATAIPLPTEILTSALLAGGESKLVISLVIVAGSSVGGIINYWLGYGGGKLFSRIGAGIRKLFRIKEKTDGKQENKSDNILKKFGWIAIFFSPFMIVIGDIILMSAGGKKLDFKKYMLFMIGGKIFKTVIIIGLLGIIL